MNRKSSDEDSAIELEDQTSKPKQLKQLTLTQIPFIFPVPSPKKSELNSFKTVEMKVFTQCTSPDESSVGDDKSESLLSNDNNKKKNGFSESNRDERTRYLGEKKDGFKYTGTPPKARSNCNHMCFKSQKFGTSVKRVHIYTSLSLLSKRPNNH